MSTSFCYVFIFEKCTCITQFGNDSLVLSFYVQLTSTFVRLFKLVFGPGVELVDGGVLCKMLCSRT